MTQTTQEKIAFWEAAEAMQKECWRYYVKHAANLPASMSKEITEAFLQYQKAVHGMAFIAEVLSHLRLRALCESSPQPDVNAGSPSTEDAT